MNKTLTFHAPILETKSHLLVGIFLLMLMTKLHVPGILGIGPVSLKGEKNENEDSRA